MRTSKKQLFKITVNNWSDKNPGRRGSFKKTMIANNFCYDNKLGTLPLSHRWLFLGLVLSCGDHNSDTLVMNERQLRALLESSKSVISALDALQSLQLVTYSIESAAPFLNELKKGREEKEEKEPLLRKGATAEKPKPEPTKTIAPLGAAKVPTKPSPPDQGSLVNQQTALVIAAYCQAFKARYNARPILGGKERGIIQRILKDLAPDKISAMLQIYLQMQDPWFDKKKHDLATFEQNLNKIAVSLQTGKDDRPEDPFSFLNKPEKGLALT